MRTYSKAVRTGTADSMSEIVSATSADRAGETFLHHEIVSVSRHHCTTPYAETEGQACLDFPVCYLEPTLFKSPTGPRRRLSVEADLSAWGPVSPVWAFAATTMTMYVLSSSTANFSVS